MTTQLKLKPEARRLVPVPLTAVRAGATAHVHEVRDAEARTLLRSLGLFTASRFRLCQIGDPCIIQVRSTRIGLSKVVARSIHVAVIERDMP